MKIKKLIIFGYIIAATVFASFFGGSFSYALLYAGLAIPATCLIYLIFVYARLKIHQVIDSKIVVKGEKVGYKFMFTNESHIHFVYLKPEFISDYSKVEINNIEHEISLVPGEKCERQTELTCLYRGEYKVGIKAVVIRDYIGLFQVKMKYPSTTNMRVYPRVVKLNSLSVLNFNEDIKSLPFTVKKGQEQDADIQKFLIGENIKTINWKVSAKYAELLARRRIEPNKEKIAIFVDTSPVEGIQKIPLEDKILEIVLSIADFYLSKKIESEIIYITSVLNRVRVTKQEDFKLFYDACLTLIFRSKEAHEYFKNLEYPNISSLILITSEPLKFINSLLTLSSSMQTCIIITGTYESRKLSEIRKTLGKTILIHIPDNCELNEILN